MTVGAGYFSRELHDGQSLASREFMHCPDVACSPEPLTKLALGKIEACLSVNKNRRESPEWIAPDICTTDHGVTRRWMEYCWDREHRSALGDT